MAKAKTSISLIFIPVIPTDKLTSYRGISFTYDEIGNPIKYYNGITHNFTWGEGRRLETVTRSGSTYSYTYNADGVRTSKTVGGVTKEYVLNGTQIVGEVWSDGTTIIYLYDAEGFPIGMLYRTSSYAKNVFDVFWYEKNLQGDIIAVYGADGTKLVGYYYDAWGSLFTTYHNGGASSPAKNNPFTYRGYYRDAETGFYYLNSRYYDPFVGRFINADAMIAGNVGNLQGYNLFAYCFNNPVNLTDGEGEWPKWLAKAVAVVAVAIVVAVVIVVAEIVGPNKEEHFSRNDNNPDFPDKYKGNENYYEGWDDKVSAKCHQFTAPNKDNIKLVSPDGKYEVIYDSDWDEVTDSRDVGTYNFADSRKDPIGHFMMDIYPWIKWGNSPEDTTTPVQRFCSMLGWLI